MKKFRIPQEVQREDRIFGPITMRRLIILTVGGGLVYMIYLGLKDMGWASWFFPVFILGSFVIALAFLEPFGMRFEKFIARAIEFFFLPRLLLWDKRYSTDVFFEYISYSDRKWKYISGKKEPKKDIYDEKQRQKKEVLQFLSELKKEIPDIKNKNIHQ